MSALASRYGPFPNECIGRQYRSDMESIDSAIPRRYTNLIYIPDCGYSR